MKKVLSILSITFGVLTLIGLSIWIGFPMNNGFDRTAICYLGCAIGFSLIAIGVGSLFMMSDIL